jgi:catalase
MREQGPDVGQRFVDSLTREERAHFLEQTVEQHFKSVMKAFNKMTREERQRMVKHSMEDMNRNQTEGRNMDRLKQDDEEVFDKVVEKGLGAYYEDASAETKLDLAPLMERMQQRLRGFGGNGMGGR